MLSAKQIQGPNIVWGWNQLGAIWGYSVACACVGVYMYLSKVTEPLIFFFVISLYPSTQIGVTAALLTTIVGVIYINETWRQEWDVIPISLQVSRMKQRKALKPLSMV